MYVDQPEGFETETPSGERLVLKLNKSLYGLKQSGRNWNYLLHNFFSYNGFIQSPIDTYVYSRTIADNIVIVLVWVDDIIVAARNDYVLFLFSLYRMRAL